MIENTDDERGVHYFFEIMFKGRCPEIGKYVPRPNPYLNEHSEDYHEDTEEYKSEQGEGTEIQTDEPEDFKEEL